MTVQIQIGMNIVVHVNPGKPGCLITYKGEHVGPIAGFTIECDEKSTDLAITTIKLARITATQLPEGFFSEMKANGFVHMELCFDELTLETEKT